MFQQRRLILKDPEEYKRKFLEEMKMLSKAGINDLKNELLIQEATPKLTELALQREMAKLVEFAFKKAKSSKPDKLEDFTKIKEALMAGLKSKGEEFKAIMKQPTRAKQQEALDKYRKSLVARFKREARN